MIIRSALFAAFALLISPQLMLLFHEDFVIKGSNAKSSPAAAAGRSEPTGSIEHLDRATAAQRGDGTPDIVVGTHAARVTSAAGPPSIQRGRRSSARRWQH